MIILFYRSKSFKNSLLLKSKANISPWEIALKISNDAELFTQKAINNEHWTGIHSMLLSREKRIVVILIKIHRHFKSPKMNVKFPLEAIAGSYTTCKTFKALPAKLGEITLKNYDVRRRQPSLRNFNQSLKECLQGLIIGFQMALI